MDIQTRVEWVHMNTNKVAFPPQQIPGCIISTAQSREGVKGVRRS